MSFGKALSRLLGTVGLIVLSFLFGAAVMFFQLPFSGLLGNAFLGGRAWFDRVDLDTRLPDPATYPPVSGTIDVPDKTCDGFTLFTPNMHAEETAASVVLINMRRDIVHRWQLTRDAFPLAPQQAKVRTGGKAPPGAVFDAHLYPNGDLLVVIHGLNQNTSGLGITKLDKDSNVLWKYADHAHHNVDVGADGRIYGIVHRQLEDPPTGLDAIPPPWHVDDLVILSPDGKELKRISIFDALNQPRFAAYLSWLGRRHYKIALPPGVTVAKLDQLAQSRDVMHTNSVRVLGKGMASKFPQFKAGQLLVSLRNMNLAAVLDPDTGSAVWAAAGPWRSQHELEFLENGHLLLFDNFGSPKGSRVLEYDPLTQSFPWTYPGDNDPAFFSRERGMSQRLPNGNTLILNSTEGTLFEVTHDHEIVWSHRVEGFVAMARRYSPDQVRFLNADQKPRP